MAEAFTTARLAAERLAPAHLPAVRVFHDDAAMMAMIGGCRDAPSSVAYLATHDQHWARHGFGFWLLRDRASGAAIGLGGLRVMPLDGVPELEVGYGFLPAWWGRGLATEAATAFVHAGEQLGDFTSLVAVVAPGNAASERVLSKLGFGFEREITQREGVRLLFQRPGSGGAAAPPRVGSRDCPD